MAQAGRAQRAPEHRINDRVRAPNVRLIGSDGSQVGVVTREQALDRARAEELDLVEVASAADPPVCKIMDYGKFKYQESIRAKEARKKQAHLTVKEIKFRPKIGVHDYETKKGHVERFLGDGHKVKVTVMFRGREMHHTELGARLLDRLAADLEGMATVEVASKLDGRNMTMMFASTRRKEAARGNTDEHAGEVVPSPEPTSHAEDEDEQSNG